jgi:hypothetical protein
MLRLPIYSKKEMLMMMEYGFTLSEVAHERGLPLSKEVVQRLEDILIKELRIKGWKQVTLEMVPNILAAFETK